MNNPTATFTDGNNAQLRVTILGLGELPGFFKVITLEGKRFTVHRDNLSNILMAQSLLPHRFRESSFRKYEHIIGTIVRHFPTVLEHHFDGSPVTFTCRLRDAMKSFLDNKWTSQVVDYEAFKHIYGDIVVSEHEGRVFTGSRESIKNRHVATDLSKLHAHIADAPTQAIPRLVVHDISTLEALCVLLSARTLTGPYTLEGIRLEATDVQRLEQFYDVAINIDEQGVTIT